LQLPPDCLRKHEGVALSYDSIFRHFEIHQIVLKTSDISASIRWFQVRVSSVSRRESN
jgi:hypothetical protein